MNKSIVFNYSNIDLSDDMETLLNKGLNFSILPYKLDMTQVWVDLKRFERSAVWTEFWHGREDQESQEPQIFKEHKTNLPKNNCVPEGLKTFLSSVRSELQDHRNRNSAECNLTKGELAALKQLQQLQK